MKYKKICAKCLSEDDRTDTNNNSCKSCYSLTGQTYMCICGKPMKDVDCIVDANFEGGHIYDPEWSVFYYCENEECNEFGSVKFFGSS